MTKIGYLKKSPLRESIEPGFERLTRQDAECIIEDVQNVVGKWSMAALKTGYVDGSDETPLFSD